MLLTLRQRIIFFICISVFGFLIAGLAGGFIISKFPDSTPAMRIAAVCQSLFQLILPAIVTAVVVTRQPADFLAVNRKVNFPVLALAVAALIAATPAMNYIIALNQSMTFPESLSWLEQSMKSMEENAARSISLLQGGSTVGDLIMSVLIIGCLAGFGEELFFRGTFMRLLTTGRVNPHVAIWTVAIVFSAIHLQFYGFVPRTLLGAYFGYILYWSRCLWIPVIVHAVNNILYIVFQWISDGDENNVAASLGSNGEFLSIAVSVSLTALLLVALYKARAASR